MAGHGIQNPCRMYRDGRSGHVAGIRMEYGGYIHGTDDTLQPARNLSARQIRHATAERLSTPTPRREESGLSQFNYPRNRRRNGMLGGTSND